MPDILNTSLTGLLAFQNGLATTSHNIANVNTEGYSRQRVQFGTLPATNTGAGFIGRGVQIESITRVFDEFRMGQLRENVAEQSRLETLYQLSSGIDDLLASPDSGLSVPLQNFTSSVQTLADNPASISARQVLLADANTLADRFHSLADQYNTLSAEVNTRLNSTVNEVNALAGTVADLNLAIRDASAAAGGSVPNDLLDQRDQALQQLAGQIGIDVVDQADGTVSVFVGNGQPLVLGQDANELTLVPGEFPSANPTIAIEMGGGTSIPLPDVSGGTVGGLMDFRREVLDPGRNSLGQLATALAHTFNSQHRDGMDLDGNLGGDFFSVVPPEITPATSNTGAGNISVAVTDVGQLTNADYNLDFDGATYTLTRTDSGASIPLSGSGTPADPYTADGLSIIVNTAPAADDTFLIRPTIAAAAGFQVSLSDPRGIAAAVPVVSSASLTNTGTGSISGDEILDVTDPNLLDPVTIQFIDPTSYSINGAGSFAFTPGDPIEVNGWRVRIEGAPEAGDTFTITSNAGGVGDNRNALSLSAALDGGVLSGGTTSIRQGFEDLVSHAATASRRSGINLTAQNAVTERALADHLAISGVNLDEEAANMLRFQQSYQAIAQMIGVADVLFQTILSVTSR